MFENKKILMALMGLEIGGAETHVVELSKELSKRGMNIIVASNGGIYEEELYKSNITHYKIPLHNKNPMNVIKSFLDLKNIIEKENIDLVHAHARIPAFICGLIRKSYPFPFVTTAHWVFNTRWGLKHVTNWGQKTIAVSEDIKKYLIDQYKMDENNIKVTINGIDMNKFSSEISYDYLLEEFDIDRNKNKIVYISRLDTDRSMAAFQLINAAEKLAEIFPETQYIIVGGGNDFERIKQKADTLNSKFERELIKITGARTDINAFVAMSDLVIGVSRSALEAMSAGKPVIISGNEGYMGLYDESKLEGAIKNNFTCRGFEQSDTQKLVNDIKLFFHLDEEDKRILGEYGKETIEKYYSVQRMADDTLLAYSWALKE